MKKMHMLFLALLLAAGMGQTVQAGSKDRAVIVMPVRYTVVQFAFDVARIRSVELLAYDKGVGNEPLLLHVWDTAARNWKPAEVAAYRDGSLFTTRPKRVFLVGGDADLPAELAAAPAWARDVTPVRSLKVIDMANTMNGKMKFSNREWKKLAARHNLELVDENAAKRKYGRYGKPGTTPHDGPRPVNPLVARFRSLTKDKPAMEEAVEESVEIEPIETEPIETEPAEMDDAVDAGDAATETTGLPAAEGEVAGETMREAAAQVAADMAPDEK